jgi:hypothetical protein
LEFRARTTIASRRRKAAGFSMQMLGGTPAGDAYTFAELEEMFRNAVSAAANARTAALNRASCH